MNYRERLQDYLEILNHTMDTVKYDKDIPGAHLYITGDELIIADGGEYEYMLVSSDEENNTFVTINDDGDEWVYKKVALNTREQYLSFCNELMDRVLSPTVSSAHTYYYQAELENYILEFAKMLKSEWNCFRDVSLNSVPIHITGEDAHDDDGEYGNITTGGTYKPYCGLITLNNVRKELEEEDKRNARHETIHFLIDRAGLPCYDNYFAFWFFATIYDAHPYMEMDEDNKKCFEMLTTLYQKYGKEAAETALSQLIDNLKKSA